jgi:hypothetical protein
MTLSEDNRVVHGLWVGSTLSNLEVLTLLSFVNNGHEFRLWTYDDFQSAVPRGVTLCDASNIIPKEKVFRRRHDDPVLGIGKGSIGSPFSDLFRYRLLYEHGGWWTDMDVTCLRPLSHEMPYYFRAHPILPVIGNVIKAPRESELMAAVIEESERRCDAGTLDWLLPNRILNHHIKVLGLQQYIRNEDGPRDWWEDIRPMVIGRRKPMPSWSFIHWMNEEWRSRGLNKDDMIKGSTLGNLAFLHGLPVRRPSLLEWMKLILS